MPIFDAYLMIDWSASNVPKRGKDSIWIAYGERSGSQATVLWNRNFATRVEAVAAIVAAMTECLAAGRRLMAGFDFAFGYPTGAAMAMTGAADWRAVWSLLADRVTDNAQNRSNRFDVAAGLNHRLAGAGASRFWGHPAGRSHDGLRATKPVLPNCAVSERRVVEGLQPATMTVWQLCGAGAVGSQSLLGIAALETLRRHPLLSDAIAVWPFETGFADDLSKPIVVTEIYPSLLPVECQAGEVIDAAQVRTVVETFAVWDAEGALRQHLACPPALDPEAAAAVLREEGFIVGAATLTRPKSRPSRKRAPALDYIRDPDEIYRQSFATIEREADFSNIPATLKPVAVRLIHACGMVDLTGDLAFSPDAAEAGRAALLGGAPVLCDVEMVRHGIIGRLLPGANEVLCLINDRRVAGMARKARTTRSAAQVDLWTERLGGAVVAIGNAPTALFRLLELIDAGAPKPALIVGMPVGFVGAAESKAALAANPRGVPFVTVRGRRGGSAMAAAAVNALAGGLD